MTPNLILTNAHILTMDILRPRAAAVALAGERIVALGRRDAIEAMAGPETRIIDCHGATVLPGFVESHMHLGLGGANLTYLPVGALHGGEQLGKALRTFAKANPDSPLLMGQGCHYAMYDHPMSRHDLDAIIADRPVALMAFDLHTVWANTAALRAAGLLNGAQMPAGHEVVMGPDGLATGELREFEAFAPIFGLGGDLRLNLGIATGEDPNPWPDAAAQAFDRATMARGLAHCARHGITSIVNMDGNRYTLELLRAMQQAGELTARVKVPFHFKPHMELSALERASEMTRDFNDDWLSSGFVKMFMDGVVDSRTAFMLRDYPGHPGHRGMPLFSPARFGEICTEADRRGLQIATHAVGDGAVRAVIDGYEAASRANGARDSRHRIEHIEMIDPADLARLAPLGIVGSIQPIHAPGVLDFDLEPAIHTLGLENLQRAYLCSDLAQAGVQLAFASDWPVADVTVLRGIQAALTRRPFDAPGASDQRLSLIQTLKAYTSAGAYAAHRNSLTGTLKVGMAADMVVLSGDIEMTPVDEIAAMHVALTVAGGRITHQA